MRINSQTLFQELFSRLTLDADQGEKEAILYLLMGTQLQLRRIDIMKGEEIDVDSDGLIIAIDRLNKNEPIQYVLAEADFYKRKFYVNKDVLIPRPETELLVRMAIEYAKGKSNLIILDIGTGSGCIANTLALELSSAMVVATDVSNEALLVAKRNSGSLHTSIRFYQHDILKDPLPGIPLDIVVSNPPYVLESEKVSMQANVIEHEPSLALFVEDMDPLIFYRVIATKAKSSLKPGGLLLTEINEHFGEEVVQLFQSIGFFDVRIAKDLDGKDRVVSGINR